MRCHERGDLLGAVGVGHVEAFAVGAGLQRVHVLIPQARDGEGILRVELLLAVRSEVGAHLRHNTLNDAHARRLQRCWANIVQGHEARVGEQE